ncbi:MAG: hypothetical protein QXK76_00370 [Candidatus Woesearchaeota archaeon]
MSTIKNDEKQTYYLTSESILKYFLNKSETLDTLIMCKASEINITTTDFNLYEALGSIEDRDNFNINKLIKFLEAVRIEPGPKRILTHERVEELRKLAFEY